MFESLNTRSLHSALIRVTDASLICEREKTDFYSVIVEPGDSIPASLGKQYYDYTDGVAYFIPPGTSCKAFSQFKGKNCGLKGRALFFSPELLTDTCLEDIETSYSFFRYKCRNEALHLSVKEMQVMNSCLDGINEEITQETSDDLSAEIIINRLELLLNYSRRFYTRQFILRHDKHCKIIAGTEERVRRYFLSPCTGYRRELPSAGTVARIWNISQAYLEDLVMSEKGMTWIEFIREQQSEVAGQEVLHTVKSITTIARETGFPSLHCFNVLFRKRHGCSPSEYRKGAGDP